MCHSSRTSTSICQVPLTISNILCQNYRLRFRISPSANKREPMLCKSLHTRSVLVGENDDVGLAQLPLYPSLRGGSRIRRRMFAL